MSQDHSEVKQLPAVLEAGPAAGAATGQDPREARRELVERLIIEESKHEAVEEEYVRPAVRELMPDGDDLADHAIEQEQAAKYVLDELDGLDAANPRFEELVSGLVGDARAHIEYEEATVWPRLHLVMPAERAHELGKKISEAKEAAPTRPHPHTPPTPGILKTAGTAAAVAGRVRDAATGRDDH